MSAEQERSVSRGRQDAFVRFFCLPPSASHCNGNEQQSSGRGGVGNIRRTSTSRDARPSDDGPDDFSPTRGREMTITPKVTHTGRGGAGNIRSPSRDPVSPTPAEREIIAHAAEGDAELPHSSGRGGLGNIVTPRSRSRSRPADAVHSSGRGGAGNIVSGAAGQALLEEQERREHHAKEGMCVFVFLVTILNSLCTSHSSGRGGAGNLVSSASPGIDTPPHAHEQHEIHSSGRGGAGNIREASRTRDGSRTRDSSVPRVSTDTSGRSRSTDRGVVAGIWNRAMSKERKE
jgi:Protein of unknown function (DUF3602)